MQYLIDGHNLIAKMPDISLQDPDDEVQLILRLRSWTAASRKRQVTVYFDGGLPGGQNVKLSTSQVQVIFASMGKTADALIIKHLQQVQNPPEYLLISSDQQIIQAAVKRKMPFLRSEKFARHLEDQWQNTPPGPTVTDDDPTISEAEVQEWLTAFGPVDEKALRGRAKPIPPNRPPSQMAADEATEPEIVEPASNNREDPQMGEKELQEWLDLFGRVPQPQAKKPAPPTKTPPPSPRKKRKKSPNPHNLKREDLDAWEAFIGREE
ncbi:MAG: hypothetical protein GY796_36930 [Chloroflexi bacterium]|nr:hypothetical protein [Chloroflexota bacterium]